MDPVTAYIGSQVVGASMNWLNTSNTNNTNNKINKRNLNFQEEQNEITRAREDNAYQRQATDMEKAGINRLMAGQSGGAQASGGLGAPSMIPMQRNDVGNIISNAGNELIPNLKRTAEIEKINTETEMNNIYKEYIGAEKTAQIALVNQQIENAGTMNEKTKQEMKQIFQNIRESEENVSLKQAERKLMGAKTQTEAQNALKVAKTLDLIDKQISVMSEQEGNLNAQTYKAVQEMKTSAATAEKLYAEVEKIVTNTKIDEINLKWMESGKFLERMGQGAGILGNLLNGMGFYK